MYSTSHSPSDLFKGKVLHSAESGHELDTHFAAVHEAQTQASSLPPGLLERGAVTTAAEMTTAYTDATWVDIIADVQTAVGDNIPDATYKLSGPFSKTIDHTLLKLDAQASQIDDLCAEAREHQFATVCVRPDWVAHCIANLASTDVRVASVIGFHEGTYDFAHKSQETKLSLASGALELDIVLNYPQLQQRQYAAVYHELAGLRAQAPHPATLKLILETSQLSRAQIIAACVLAGAANFDFVKTSTGFNGAGASVENVRLMRRCCEVIRERDVDGQGVDAPVMRVKASGGVRSVQDARNMLTAGASRLGTSSGVALVGQAGEGGKSGQQGESY